ncbi:hypothetical protein J3B02_003121, partial [Coemansia erecta]
ARRRGAALHKEKDIIELQSAVSTSTSTSTSPVPADPILDNRAETDDLQPTHSRAVNVIKLLVFAWLSRWVIRYFEIDRSLCGEPNTPHISMLWVSLSIVSLLPFVSVYLYASVWRRRVLGEPLDLQNWQSSANSLVHAATLGLLFSWTFAIIAFFPGHGLKSILIVIACTVCMVAITDAVEGIFS